MRVLYYILEVGIVLRQLYVYVACTASSMKPILQRCQ